MNTLHDILLEQIALQVKNHENPAKKARSINSKVIQQIAGQIAGSIFKELKKSAPAMLKDLREENAGFQKRNFKRWKKGFDLLEMLWHISMEAAYFANQPEPKNITFGTLRNLHAKALLITQEIVCLLKGGFADGALSRWRSLHEISVVSFFLAQHGDEATQRYLESFEIHAYKAMLQYNEYSKRAKLKKFKKREVEKKKVNYEIITGKYGDDILSDYGWSAKFINKKRPTLFDLEKSIGMDHWRPYYKWASHYTHPNHKPIETFLGLAESNVPTLLVGPSNSGLTDPAQLTAISLTNTTLSFLLLNPNFDQIVMVKIIQLLKDQIGSTFMKVEKETFERFLASQLKKLDGKWPL
jgi:hypothetical protein